MVNEVVDSYGVIIPQEAFPGPDIVGPVGTPTGRMRVWFIYATPSQEALFGEKLSNFERAQGRVIKTRGLSVGCILGGGQKIKKFDFELAYKLPPFSWSSWFQKHKDLLWTHMGSAASGNHIFDPK